MALLSAMARLLLWIPGFSALNAGSDKGFMFMQERKDAGVAEKSLTESILRRVRPNKEVFSFQSPHEGFCWCS